MSSRPIRRRPTIRVLDDLTFDWTFAPDAFSASNVYFNDGVGPDGMPSSHGVFPVSVTDSQSVTFSAAGIYTVAVTVTDDDGGSAFDSQTKIVTGDCDCARSKGFWKHQFKASVEGKGKQQIEDAELETYLSIVNYASSVFSESVALSGLADANNVFNPDMSNNGGGDNGSKKKQDALQQALAAWLNFAKGAIDWDEMIDTDGDGVADTAFNDLIAQVEAILNDPDSTAADFEQAKDLAETIADWKARGLVPDDALPDDDPLGWLVNGDVGGDVDSVISAAYKFAAEHPAISSVVSGASSIDHMERNVAAMERPYLSAESRLRLERLFGHIAEYA